MTDSRVVGMVDVMVLVYFFEWSGFCVDLIDKDRVDGVGYRNM